MSIVLLMILVEIEEVELTFYVDASVMNLRRVRSGCQCGFLPQLAGHQLLRHRQRALE